MAAVRKRVSEAAARDAFLGVAASARGFVWRERLPAHAEALAAAIAQRLQVPETVGRILAARGVGLDGADSFLDPTLKGLMPDPACLLDMGKAAARIADAIRRGERVAIFGDYDVDGACAAALLARLLTHYGVPHRIYIPDRLYEGYGPNAAAIEMLAREGAALIVTVDCGTTSFEALAVARQAGADVVVIDHHQADERLPDVHAVVNPNRQDDLSDLGHLCAAGVVFMTLVAIQRDLRARQTPSVPPLDLLGLLDLVALATVCDVVPLQTLNRAFVVQGLKMMHQRRNTGLRALLDAASLDEAPTPYHLGYVVGPRINAGGRIGDSGLGARLLTLDDDVEAARIAATLDRLNRERMTLEAQMLDEAVATAEQALAAEPDLPMLVIASERFHKGVVGLVASRLTDRFRRPSCVIAWNTGEGGQPRDQGTGSLRSIAGVDIGGAVRGLVAAGTLAKGGGHAMAAGLTVTRDKFEAVAQALRGAVATSSATARAAFALEVDGALTPSAATADFMTLIEKAGPYGQGHPQPRFVFPAHRVRFAKVVGDKHVRATLEAGDGSRIEAIAFRAVGQAMGELLMASSGAPLHVAGTLKRDTWGGRNRVELTIDDVADPRACG
jgi:single-stranded-DNA-specific exonuclease